MELLNFNQQKCDLCGECIKKCPFSALSMGEHGIEVNAGCKMCGVCVKTCPHGAIRFEQKAGAVDKSKWKDILIYAEQENGRLHPVTFELIGEARRLAAKVNYRVHALIIGEKGTRENGELLLNYGVTNVYTYEHPGFHGFMADCYTDAAADCIATLKPSVVLIGATPAGRSMAPRLSTRFHTGLTADCTKLDIRENTDLVQIRPAFGGNVMAQILIADSRPQFATVRYKIMDRAERLRLPEAQVIACPVNDDMVRSGIQVREVRIADAVKSIEEEEILVVAGRGIKSQQELDMLARLAELLGGQLCFSRPMVEVGHGDSAHQIGLSGRTVKPKLILTFGVSGAIQFTACMNGAEHIIAVNTDPKAQIFQIAHTCIAAEAGQILPLLLEQVQQAKEDPEHAISL